MTSDSAKTMLDEIASALKLSPAARDQVGFAEGDRLPSCFPVSDLAVASIGAACAAIADLSAGGDKALSALVDYRLAALWFGWSIRPIGWEMPPTWDAIAGDYQARDGWIKLHTNAPHHRAAALAVLGCDGQRDAVACVVSSWEAEELETAIVSHGGCAAKLRSHKEWASHPQGSAVASEPLIIWDEAVPVVPSKWRPTAGRPLAGLKVLDLTRVIAGPVATRFLAGYGAEVLRLDPRHWDEPSVIPEVSLGKRCARLDLRDTDDRQTFSRLLAQADILVHGYRADALDHLGFGAQARQAIRPGLIDISLNAYGHSGPWAARRGFDSLVQFSCGIADAGMTWRQSDSPVSLPVQALDHAKGYLIAAAAIRALIARCDGQGALVARLSLARTAKLLIDNKGHPAELPFAVANDADFADQIEKTAWGPAQRVRPPSVISGVPMSWQRPASALGSSSPDWAV